MTFIRFVFKSRTYSYIERAGEKRKNGRIVRIYLYKRITEKGIFAGNCESADFSILYKKITANIYRPVLPSQYIIQKHRNNISQRPKTI